MVRVALYGVPEGKPPVLGRMADRKPHMFGLVANGQSHMFGFVAHLARRGAQAMPDVAGIVIDVGRCGRARRSACPQHDAEERKPAQAAAWPAGLMSPKAGSVRNMHGDRQVNDESTQV